MKNRSWVEFELRVVTVVDPVRVRISDHGERCVASVRCGATGTSGLGANAREALVAALAPLGARTSAAVMAAPAMFAASAQVLAARAAM